MPGPQSNVSCSLPNWSLGRHTMEMADHILHDMWGSLRGQIRTSLNLLFAILRAPLGVTDLFAAIFLFLFDLLFIWSSTCSLASSCMSFCGNMLRLIGVGIVWFHIKHLYTFTHIHELTLNSIFFQSSNGHSPLASSCPRALASRVKLCVSFGLLRQAVCEQFSEANHAHYHII